jgi:hypothetical protein
MDEISLQSLRAYKVHGKMPSFLSSQQMVYIVTTGILLFNVGAVVDIYVPNVNPAANVSISGYLSKNFSKNTLYIHILCIYIYFFSSTLSNAAAAAAAKRTQH